MRLREGTGGEFANIILTHATSYGVLNNDCGSEVRIQKIVDAPPSNDFLFFSEKNIIFDPITGSASMFSSDCVNPLSSAVGIDPKLANMPFDADWSSTVVDPRPSKSGSAYKFFDPVPSNDFFDSVDFSGAFRNDAKPWLQGLSWLSETGKLVETKLEHIDSGDIDSSKIRSSPNHTRNVVVGVLACVAAVAIGVAAMISHRRTRAQRGQTNEPKAVNTFTNPGFGVLESKSNPSFDDVSGESPSVSEARGTSSDRGYMDINFPTEA
jgi:hypothetical protein